MFGEIQLNNNVLNYFRGRKMSASNFCKKAKIACAEKCVRFVTQFA